MQRRFKKKEQQRFYRINDRIYARELRVLDSEGKQIGILGKDEALRKASEQELDLVEIAPKAQPPVARIIDFKKFLYQEQKKKREEKKASKGNETKEVRLGPFIEEHDLSVIVRRVRSFLEEGDKVRLVVRFKGRQMAHPEFGQQTLNKVLAQISDISKIDRAARWEGRNFATILSPEKKKSKSEKEENVKNEEKNQEIGKQKVQGNKEGEGNVLPPVQEPSKT